MITKENQHLLELLADILHNKKPKPIALDEWPIIRDELNSQGVLALTTLSCNSLQLDSKSQVLMHAQLNANMHYFYNIMKTQTTVVSILENYSIPVVVLKGSAAAMNYPVPELRLMGDIDILVPKDKFKDAFHVLCDNGYKCEENLENFNRHIGFESDTGIRIELHYYFAPNDINEKFTYLNNYLSKALEKVEHIEINGYRTPVLPTVANGLVFLSHLNQHLYEGVGLRHIIDWMCFVERYLDDELWEREFVSIAEQIGLVKLAKETTAMCKKYLGLSKEIKWCGEPNEISDKYIEYVFRQGNYALKQEEREKKAVGIIRMFKRPFKALAKAQEYGIKNWELLPDHPYLKPFAWIYQIQRWIKHGLEKNIKITNMKTMINKMNKDKVLFDNLQLIEKY